MHIEEWKDERENGKWRTRGHSSKEVKEEETSHASCMRHFYNAHFNAHNNKHNTSTEHERFIPSIVLLYDLNWQGYRLFKLLLCSFHSIIIISVIRITNRNRNYFLLLYSIQLFFSKNLQLHGAYNKI